MLFRSIAKPERVFLTKADLVTTEELEKKLKVLKKIDPHVIALSIENPKSIKAIEKILNEIKAKQ